mmetsp:Transcript_21004/g.37579  ORF Transcript_21004/g.37579 Transcript_21004/m.37579 type:complete len:419 (-) Transcript_21004:117-1373(-)
MDNPTRPSKRQRISIDSCVTNDVIELLDSSERVKLAPKRIPDEDFLEALNHVSYHKIVDGTGDTLTVKEKPKGPEFKPDLTESLRELDELTQLLYAISSSPPTANGQVPVKYMELQSVQHEEVSDTEALLTGLHNRRRNLQNTTDMLQKAAGELRRNAAKQWTYMQGVLELQEKQGIMQPPTKQGKVDLQIPFKAYQYSDEEERLWELLVKCVQRLSASSGEDSGWRISLSWMTEDTLRVELTPHAHIICRRKRALQEQWLMTKLEFEANVQYLPESYAHSLLRAAVLRCDVAARNEAAERALHLKAPVLQHTRYNAELEKVFLHLQHIVYLLEIRTGISAFQRSQREQGRPVVQLQQSRPLQWPNCSTYTIVIGKARFPVSVIGTVCQLKISTGTEKHTLILPGRELLDWAAVRVQE